MIGPRLAERLGVPFVDRAIPVSVSRRLKIPVEEVLGREEAPQDALSRFAAYFAPAVQLFGGLTLDEKAVHDDRAFRLATEAALREHITGGAVILGRAAALVLRDVPHAVHVRLNGSLERRIDSGVRMLGCDRETAERELRASDLARETYVKDLYRTDPADPSLYHLVIDSTVLPFGCCEQMIEVAVRSALSAGDEPESQFDPAAQPEPGPRPEPAAQP